MARIRFHVNDADARAVEPDDPRQATLLRVMTRAGVTHEDESSGFASVIEAALYRHLYGQWQGECGLIEDVAITVRSHQFQGQKPQEWFVDWAMVRTGVSEREQMRTMNAR